MRHATKLTQTETNYFRKVKNFDCFTKNVGKLKAGEYVSDKIAAVSFKPKMIT